MEDPVKQNRNADQERSLQEDWHSVEIPEQESPQIPPLSRTDGKRPNQINLAAVMEENWVEFDPKSPMEMSFQVGRLWNSMIWLRESAIAQQGSMPIIMEAKRVRFKLIAPCRAMISSNFDTFWAIVENDERQWLRYLGSDGHESWIESLIENPLQWNPDENPLDLFGKNIDFAKAEIQTPNCDLVSFGISVDQGIRPFWSEKGTIPKPILDPWHSRSDSVVDASWRELINQNIVQINQTLPYFTVGMPHTIEVSEIETLDQNIRNELRKGAKDNDEVFGELELVFNERTQSVRRLDRSHPPINLLKNWFTILKDFSDHKCFIEHDEMKRIYNSLDRTGDKGNYPPAFSTMKTAINAKIEDLGIEIHGVRNTGWRLVSLD